MFLPLCPFNLGRGPKNSFCRFQTMFFASKTRRISLALVLARTADGGTLLSSRPLQSVKGTLEALSTHALGESPITCLHVISSTDSPERPASRSRIDTATPADTFPGSPAAVTGGLGVTPQHQWLTLETTFRPPPAEPLVVIVSSCKPVSLRPASHRDMSRARATTNETRTTKGAPRRFAFPLAIPGPVVDNVWNAITTAQRSHSRLQFECQVYKRRLPT